jgi:putative pyoverdin transport system ATP-binding/permease protein
MRLLKLLLDQSRLLLIFSIFSGIAAGAISSFMMALVNEGLSNIGHATKSMAWLFLGLALASIIAKLTSRLLLMRMSTRTVRDLRLNLCGQLLKAPLRDVEKSGPSALMATLTEDVTRVAEALIALPEQCGNGAVAVACFVYLFWLSWPLALIYVGIFAVGIFIYRRIARRARPAMDKARSTWDLLIEHYNGLIHGNKELKLHRQRRNAFDVEGVGPTAVAMMNYSWGWNWILAVANANTQIIFFSLLGTALFIAPNYGVFAPGVLSGFVLMSLFMGGPISSIVGSLPQFNQADVALKKIDSLGLSLASAEHRDVKDTDAGEITAPRFNQIEIRGLEYVYSSNDNDKTFSLGPIDLRINAGELIFVIGGNGSGKSSFARILTGLYTQTAGELLLDSERITDANRDDYRQLFSVVFSDYHLFRNLYGMSSLAFEEQAGEYLSQLELTSKVSIENGKLSTVELSAGQRKRLALLTAFLENRNIYLFDEWAADQDPAFKRVFYHRILPELKAQGKTVIVISHDNQYFDLADRVVRFDNGRIVEDRLLSHAQAVPAKTAERETLEADLV